MRDGPTPTNREPGLTCQGCRWLRKERYPITPGHPRFVCQHKSLSIPNCIGLDASTPVWCPVVKQSDPIAESGEKVAKGGERR